MPKARRRHSTVFIASSLIMFGGFDGNFYNDLNILHTNKLAKERILVSKSTLHLDLASTVNESELSDIEFILGTESD
jgi:hypothetical protein